MDISLATCFTEKKGCIDMGRNRNHTPGTHSQQNSVSIGGIMNRTERTIAYIGAILGIVVVLVTFTGWCYNLQFKLDSLISTSEKNMESINEKFAQVNTDITLNRDSISKMQDKFEKDFKDYKYEIDRRIELSTPTGLKVVVNNKFLSCIRLDEKEFIVTTELDNIDAQSIIATDYNTGLEYTVNELEDKKLLYSYQENGQDVIFYGQYNENMHWDGNCLLNVYEDDILIAISDITYNDGVAQSYEQIIADTLNGQDVWIYGNKTIKNGINSGVNKTFIRNKEHTKNFEIADVNEQNLLIPSHFTAFNDMKLLACYLGDTSNGMYNDLTGKALLINFFNDGSFHTLYNGKFVDGKFEDFSGNAWEISRDPVSGNIMYFKGKFLNNKSDSTKPNDFRNYLTNSDVYNILKENDIESIVESVVGKLVDDTLDL